MKFFDADVKRAVASVSAVIGEGNRAVSTGQRTPMRRERGVFVLQLDAQPSTKPFRSVTFGGPVSESESGCDPGVVKRCEERWARLGLRVNLGLQGSFNKVPKRGYKEVEHVSCFS